MSGHLEHFASRVRNDPAFLASALAAYSESEGLDRADLVKKLGCPMSALAPLSLCRMPRSDTLAFIDDIERIAERFEVNVDALAEIVRRGQAVMKMRAASPASAPAGPLAARDKERRRRPQQGEAE